MYKIIPIEKDLLKIRKRERPNALDQWVKHLQSIYLLNKVTPTENQSRNTILLLC